MPKPPIERRTRVVVRRVQVSEHRCQYCGTWFETRRSNARYCPQPARCRVYAFRDRAQPTQKRSQREPDADAPDPA